MIEAKGEDFTIEGDMEEICRDFGGICLSLIKEGFTGEILIEMIEVADRLFAEHGDEIFNV